MDSDVWTLVEKAASNDKRSTNKWIEILLIAHFLKEKLKKS